MEGRSLKRTFEARKDISFFNSNVIVTIILLQLVSLILIGPELNFQLAILITISQAVLLFYNIGKILPVRLLIGTMYSLNYLFVPMLMYSGLNDNVQENYRCVGDPEIYFSYAVPAMLMLILGLNMFMAKNDAALNVDKVMEIAKKNPKLPFYLIVVGLISGFIAPYVPTESKLFFDSVAYFKFAGFFLSLFNGRPVNKTLFFLSYGSLILTSLITSLFNDLLNMLFFLGFMLAIRYKASFQSKVFGIAVVIAAVVVIQILKFPLRERVSGNLSDITKLDEAITESKVNNNEKTDLDKVADVLMRLDQGWVTSKTIEYQAGNGYQFQKGNHMLVVVESAIFPRLLVPDKLKVGDPQEFNRYSGHQVQSGTSIGLGLLADGYIDFGFGGIYVTFVFGCIISIFLRIYNRWEKKYPMAKIFLPVGFFYAVRPDNDTQAALGALLKVTLIIWLTMIYIGRNHKFFSKNIRKVKLS